MPCERVWVVLRVLVAGLPDKGLSFAVIAVAIIVIAGVIIAIALAIIVIASAITIDKVSS